MVFMPDWHRSRCLLAINWVVNAAHKRKDSDSIWLFAFQPTVLFCFIKGAEDQLGRGPGSLTKRERWCLSNTGHYNDKYSSELCPRSFNIQALPERAILVFLKSGMKTTEHYADLKLAQQLLHLFSNMQT